jgi:methylenetetrahydrofolate--tRNA-(uracil-5-)-methyltransferase
LGLDVPPLPTTSALGALVNHITGGHVSDDADAASNKPRSFQPMNINFGLFPPHDAPLVDEDGNKIKGKAKGLARKQAMAKRALRDSAQWVEAFDAMMPRQAAE